MGREKVGADRQSIADTERGGIGKEHGWEKAEPAVRL